MKKLQQQTEESSRCGDNALMTDQISPLVSVIMPVYNGSSFVQQTIESILNQTVDNFEFIIVDDCSTDDSYEILKLFADKDVRIKVFRTSEHFGNPGGPTAFAIEQVSEKSKYIVMTDQDDISVSNRLKYQIDFMENNPRVDIAGGRLKMFGQKSRITHPPENDKTIKARLLTSCPLSNPTLIIRKSFLDENNYNYRNQASQDYRFLAEAALEHKACFHNLKSVLVHYRCHNNQTSYQKNKTIKENSNQVREYQLGKLGIMNQQEIDFFNLWKAKKIKPVQENLKILHDLLSKIIALNSTKQLYPHQALLERLSYLYRKELLKSKKLGNVIRAVTFKFL